MNGKVPCGDTFLSQFNKLYLNNEFKIQENLVTLLLKALVMKMVGQKNARYNETVRNFFVALAVLGNKQAYEYVPGNLGQIMTH